MKRLGGVYLGAALVLAGCSGAGADGSEAAPASSGAAAEQSTAASVGEGGGEASQAEASSSANPDDLLGFGKETNTAVVTIGDQQYEFGDLYCVTMGGALGAQSVGGDPQVSIDLPPENWESSSDGWSPPSVQISGDDPYTDLRAGGDIVSSDARVTEGQSQVDSFSSDGHHATGSATFVDYNAVMLGESAEPMTATFEVTCPS